MQKLLGVTICFCLSSVAVAKDLGHYGQSKEIVEQSPIMMFDQKAKEMEKDGAWKALEQKMIAKAKARILRPKPVEGLTKTNSPREYLVNRREVVEEDIVDYDGNIIFKKGDAFNQLEYRASSKALLFFDGDDPDQVAWAINEYQKRHGLAKPTLINGAPLELAKTHNIRFFFDQGGSLVREFEIEQVPAIVSQKGAQLLVQEIKL